MWKKTAPLLVILSVAINIAFVGVWAARALASGGRQPATPPAKSGDRQDPVWCPLHRQLGVSPEQWKQLEPRLVQFRKSSQAVCQDVTRKRAEMIELVAASQPDREAIAAKQQEILAGQQRMQSLVIEHLLAERQVLTPAQQTALFDLLRQRSQCSARGPMMMGLGSGPDGTPCTGPARSGASGNHRP